MAQQLQIPTPIQTASTTSNPPVQPQALDPDAVNLAKAIRQTESGGNFQAKGKSGEYGAYQYTDDTWNNDAKKYGVNVPLEQATKEQQNEVAYKKIKELKDTGHNVGQIASIWNSGKADAYLDPSYAGTNKSGVHYDVPAYAKSVADAYQTIKKGGQVGADPQNPSSTASTNPVAPSDTRSTLSKVIDWAFPIAGDFSGEGANKTALQKLGDLGLSAMWFLPGLGEVAEGGLRAAGLVAKGVEGGEVAAKGAGLLSKVAKGAVSGYGADVASNLSQGKTGAGVFRPGLGSVTGGILEGALGKVGSKYSESGILNDMTKSNNSILGQTKRGANDLAESFSEGKNPGELISHKGINLASEYNPETLAFDTAQHAENLRQSGLSLTDALTDALKNVPGATTATELENSLLSKAETQATDKITAAEQKQLIQSEFSKIRAEYGENLSASDMNELKKRAWNESNFDASKTNQYRRTQRLIGNTLKKNVETLADKGGLKGVPEFNQYIGSHLDAADNLERLNGTKVKGGRLGDLARKHTLAAVGGVGGFFGGGPIGSMVGALAGEYAGGKLSSILRKIEASPLKTAILNKMEREDPEIVQKVLKYAQQESPAVKQLRKEMEQQGFKIGETNKIDKGPIAPELKPRISKKGKVPGLIKKLGTRISVNP